MSSDYASPSDVLPLADKAADAVRGKLRDLGSIGREALSTQKERAIELEENLEVYVQDHPIRSMLIAAGVGVVLGALISRR